MSLITLPRFVRAVKSLPIFIVHFDLNFIGVAAMDMTNNRTENRTQTQKRVFRTAQIAVGEKAPKLECAVRDISEQGARLSVSTTFGLPQQFDIIINGQRKRGRSIWRTLTELGVVFA